MSLLDRGENAVKSKRVKKFSFSAEQLSISGEVYASMRNRFYSLTINLDRNSRILNSECTCPRGIVLCHHMSALCLFARENISPTDIECQWIAKPANKDDEVKVMEELYPSKKHVSIKRNLTEGEIDNFKQALGLYGGAVGMTWLLQPEPTSKIVDIEKLIFSEEYLKSPEKELYLLNALALSPSKCQQIKDETVGQTKNLKWYSVRKNRLTASNFGIVLNAIKRVKQGRSNKYPLSLFKRLTEAYNLEGVKAIQWGCIHEATAREEFVQCINKQVSLTGIWVHPCGFLAASPDGLVDEDNAIIKIKCPFKYREKNLTEELKRDKNYICTMSEDGNVEVNKNHDYYAQIQGQLALTEKSFCYLVIWTPEQTVIRHVYKDEEWQNNLLLLQEFYLNEYVPYLLKQYD